MKNDAKQLAERYKPKEIKSFVADPQVLTLRFSPDGKFLVAACYDGRVRRWDATQDDFPEVAAVAGHQGWAQAVAFSPDSQTIFTGDSWGELRAWPLAGETPAPKWQVANAHSGWIRDAAVSPDGKTLATCGADRTLRLWNVESGALQDQVRGENDDLYCLRFAVDGEQIVAGDRMGVVWQWKLATKELVRKIDARVLYKLDRIQDVGGVRTLALDNAGKWLAVGGMKPKNGATIQGIPALLLFDWSSGELKHAHELGGANDCDLMDVQLHDDGFFVAVTNGGPGQGQIILQKVDDSTPFVKETKVANVQSLAWHPDGRRFAVSGTNRESNGNGRVLKGGKYPGNTSPIHVFQLGEREA
jgi:WD40 repeat protein